jgi:hypothetical protein
MRRPPPILLLAALFVAAACAAAGRPAPRDAGGDLVSGEITDLAPGSFRIRPWNPRLPRRVLVTPAPDARYGALGLIRRRDLRTGDRVLAVEETDPVPPAEARDEGGVPGVSLRAAGKRVGNGRLRAVLRVAPAEDAALAAPGDAFGGRLLTAARGFFKGFRRGGTNPPDARTLETPGVVESTEPLRLRVAGEVREFRVQGSTLFIGYAPAAHSSRGARWPCSRRRRRVRTAPCRGS